MHGGQALPNAAAGCRLFALNALIGAGFVIRCVDEWAPSEAQLAEQPELQDELERPMMVLISAQST